MPISDQSFCSFPKNTLWESRIFADFWLTSDDFHVLATIRHDLKRVLKVFLDHPFLKPLFAGYGLSLCLAISHRMRHHHASSHAKLWQ